MEQDPQSSGFAHARIAPLGSSQECAAAAVASLGAAAADLDAKVAEAMVQRRKLADRLQSSRENLPRLHSDQLASLAALVAERRTLIDGCTTQIALLSETVELRRVAARDSKPRTHSLGLMGELEVATRDRLQKERQAARQRLFRVRRLLEPKTMA